MGLTGLLESLRGRQALRHPVERGEPDRRTRFDAFAERASWFSSSPPFFFLCVALVAAWALGYAFGAGATYEQVMGTALTALALLLIAMLKNAELRSEAAIQAKLDALATAMLEAIREEHLDADRMLERAIRIDEET